jgi:predicted N-acetyltransferase YhbS/nuclear transport factor 2 (NTF2) superfamily protein
MTITRRLLEGTYEAFNARDVDRALATMHPDVDWPNGMDGGRVHGHDAVREYWTRQWRSIDAHVTPVRFVAEDGGRIVVDVRQVIRDRAGSLVRDEMVQHVYRLGEGLVRSLEIRKLPGRTIIRPERPEDVLAIHRLHEEAFPTPAEARLVDALRASRRLVVSLVAEEAGEIVGHVALSPVRAGASPGGLGLAPLAVASGCRCRGVGGALVRAGLDASRRTGSAFVVVLGEPVYYERFGFTVASGWGLLDEYGAGPAFQVLELRPGAVPRGAGRVRYAEEFALLNARPDDDAP